ncbi:MAG: uracil phosphoribosyltransferase [Planctomycetota bacterium]
MTGADLSSPAALAGGAVAHELEHRYGERVHVLDCPWTNAALARVSAPDCTYTELVAAVRAATVRLVTEAIAAELPTEVRAQTTRMADSDPARGVWRGRVPSAAPSIVVLDVIRGGMLPAQAAFDHLALVHPLERLRLDHLSMERIAGDDGRVSRVELCGAKVGGSTAGSIVLVPDPMGATGSTVVRAFEHLVEHHGRPAALVALPLIATPEFVTAVRDLDPCTRVWAGRLDRGASSAAALERLPGELPAEESGLDERDYILPGAGGLGELLNNSWG